MTASSPSAARPLRVLMLLHELSRTGAPKVALDAIEHLGPAVDVRFIAPADGPLADRCRSLGPLLLPFAMTRRGRVSRRIEAWKTRRNWGKVLQWQPELIYVNSVAALPLAEMLEQTFGLPPAPILLHVHELDSLLARIDAAFSHWLRRRPVLYISVSQAVTEALVTRFDIPLERIRQVPAFVPERDYTGSVSPRPGNRHLVIGGAGTPGWRKGTTLWLQTAALVHQRRPNVRFRWVGIPPGPDGEPLRRKVRLMNLEQVVEAVAPTDSPLDEFSSFDMFLMTSWEDPFPLVVLENMRLGNPVLCVPGGGAPEQVTNAGIVIERFDPADVADAVIALLDDQSRREAMANAGRERVRTFYTDEVCVPELWKVMQQVAQQEHR